MPNPEVQTSGPIHCPRPHQVTTVKLCSKMWMPLVLRSQEWGTACGHFCCHGIQRAYPQQHINGFHGVWSWDTGQRVESVSSPTDCTARSGGPLPLPHCPLTPRPALCLAGFLPCHSLTGNSPSWTAQFGHAILFVLGPGVQTAASQTSTVY